MKAGSALPIVQRTSPPSWHHHHHHPPYQETTLFAESCVPKKGSFTDSSPPHPHVHGVHALRSCAEPRARPLTEGEGQHEERVSDHGAQ